MAGHIMDKDPAFNLAHRLFTVLGLAPEPGSVSKAYKWAGMGRISL